MGGADRFRSAVGFLFYFNRLFASLVSYGIRSYTWHKYRAYIDIQALQFSLLAGRIFFKGVRYHGRNQTILIHDGYITWRYWLRHVEEPDYQRSPGTSNAAKIARDAPGDHKNERETTGEGGNEENRRVKELPCRVLVKSRGVEWFIYNRSPAYDAIFESMKEGDESKHPRDTSPVPRDLRPREKVSENAVYPQVNHAATEEKDNRRFEIDEIKDDVLSSSISASSSAKESAPYNNPPPALVNILPIRIECNRGAIVMGNRNTRSILTVRFDGAHGQIDARRSRPVDQYKQTFDFDFVHPVIAFKHNKDYTEPSVSEGAQICSEGTKGGNENAWWSEHVQFRKRMNNAWHSIRDYLPYRKRFVESLNRPPPEVTAGNIMMGDNAGLYGQNKWLGLTRYLDEDDDLIEQERWKAIEYGEFPTVVDSPSLSMSFYWDVPGLIPDTINSPLNALSGSVMDINGDAPPDWGIELKVRGGTINYGPWADRQRADMQAVFFPAPYKDASPAASLEPSQFRISTVLTVIIEIEKETILRVPTREGSKDWRWRGRSMDPVRKGAKQKKSKAHGKVDESKTAETTPRDRPFGWLDVKVMPDSTVRFSMDLVARTNGYRNLVDLDIKGLETSSSVNHGLLWRSQSQVISCDLSNPLRWNELRQWHIDIQDNSLELFILRDHMFLLTDLIDDWTSGPAGDFYTYIPFEYSIGLSFSDLRLYVNANDSNIINNPSDPHDNTFIVIWARELRADLVIPSKDFRPARNKVIFDVDAHDGGLKLLTSPRSTQHTFLDDTDVASLERLRMNGSYSYFTTTSPSLTDVLLLSVHGSSPRISLYGFMIRYFMKIKDNYFGDDIHFRTWEEYQSQVQKYEGSKVEDTSAGQHNRVSNDLDVILGITAEQSCALLPAHLYSSQENVRFEVCSIAADLRITNYYMDLAVTSSPIAISHMSHSDSSRSYSNTQVFIDGIEILGHRLFGLPPAEPTYVCNWDFEVGSISGECSIDFLRCLTMSVRCFASSFEDAENALPPLSPPALYDLTLLRARTRPIRLGLRVEQSVFLLNLGMINVKYNDWAGALFSDRLQILLPELALTVADVHGASMTQNVPQAITKTHAYVRTMVAVTRVKRRLDFHGNRQLQQEHIALHDSRSHRTPWFILDDGKVAGVGASIRPFKSRPPAMPFPRMPDPILVLDDPSNDKASLTSNAAKSASLRSLSSRKSSFLADNASSRDGSKWRTGGISVRSRQQNSGTSLRDNNLDSNHTVAGNAASYRKRVFQPGQRASYRNSPDENLMPPTSLPRSGLAFSSPYKRPYFPVLAIKPDTRDLPNMPEILPQGSMAKDTLAADTPTPGTFDSETEHSSVMINLDRGIQAFLTPEAVILVSQLLAQLQLNSPVALLDDLQIDTTMEVLKAREKHEKGSQITDIRLYVPWVGSRVVSTGRNSLQQSVRREHYNMSLESLTATFRLATIRHSISEPPVRTEAFSHVLLDQALCSASESMGDTVEDQAIISLSITHPVFWMWRGAKSAAELQFEILQVTSASRKMDHISSLVSRSMVLLEDLSTRFSNIGEERKCRLRLLLLLLTIEGKHVPDPPFLTKASYVLRGDSRHIRTDDSWKMMSCLRYIHQRLSADARKTIQTRVEDMLAPCPPDAGDLAIANFEHWRTWDLEHVRTSRLMQKVYGRMLNLSAEDFRQSTPIEANLHAGKIQVLVEPGPHQNEIAVEKLILGISLNHLFTSPTNVLPKQDSSPQLGSVIQAHCALIALRLHWALLDLIQNLVESLQSTTISKHMMSADHRVLPPSLSKNYLHVECSSENSILTLDTHNIKIISLCRGLKSSIVSLRDNSSSDGSSLSLLVGADAATTEVKRHLTPISLYHLKLPRVFGSKTADIESGVEKVWRFIGSGYDVSFQVLANPLDLIDVAENLLEHEVAYMKHWAASLQRAINPERSLPVPTTAEPAGLPEAHVALFLDSYLISLAVLPSLAYQIRGTGTYGLIRSGLRLNHNLSLEFDVREHAHLFKTQLNDTSRELSTLQMPSISGRLGLLLGPSRKAVLLNTLVESIAFDASAVHAIFSAVNRPEIISLGTSIEQGISSIRDQYDRIFEVRKPMYESVELKAGPILYSGLVTVAGLAVHTNTSQSMSVAQDAQLQFKMGRIYIKATNKEPDHEVVMKFPELEVRLGNIQLNILRSDALELRNCGEIMFKAILRSTSKLNDEGELVRAYQIHSDSLQIHIYTETASIIVAIFGHLQDTLKTFDLSHEVRSLRKFGYSRAKGGARPSQANDDNHARNPGTLFNATYSLELINICITWKIGDSLLLPPGRQPEDLVLSFTKIDLATRKQNAARLLIQDFQLQLAPTSNILKERAPNSALLPEVVFNVAYVSTTQDRRLAFQAAGKSLDLRLTSQFILPANDIRRSVALAVQQVRAATADWNASAAMTDGQTKSLLGNKKLASLLIDADFAGAIVYIQGRSLADPQSRAPNVPRGGRLPQHGRYNQFAVENSSNSSTILRAPGIAFKVEYKNTIANEQSLNAEMKVDASSNTLYPTVVPLVMEISSSIKDIVGEPDDQGQAMRSTVAQSKFLGDERLRGGDPSAIFGNCTLNLGLRVCRQEFSLSCQPIARVAAAARFEDIYFVVKTVQSKEHGRFFTISAAFTGLQISVQHVYSRESTGNFAIDSIIVSLMNSKHVSSDNGISAILKFGPMKALLNGKQAQDFLLFREIWVPPEIRVSSSAPVQTSPSESQAFIVQRYQQIAAAGAFPWNATISIDELDVQLDLGQSLGKSAFVISGFWISSKKASDWEQNLCLGFNKAAVDGKGRMSGFVGLENLKVRTSIQWPVVRKAHNQTPLVQASLAFDHLRIKAAFDYQAFLVADVTTFEFLMYNVRDPQNVSRDRLVGVLDGDTVQIFCTTTSASQAIALYQAFQRLYQEKVAAYEISLRDIEQYLRRKATVNPHSVHAVAQRQADASEKTFGLPLRLQTDVVITLNAVNLGAFPSTFFDTQIFKLEALNASARFAVILNNEKIYSNLGMTLGELRIALSGITRDGVPKALGEVSVADVVAAATGSRGGTILKVPKLVAEMETWQSPESTQIDYIFRSSFQGKVDVGWNYSRISYIRGMWASHARALAQRLGKPLPQSAVQITGGPRPTVEGGDSSEVSGGGDQDKITAVVNVPQSKYQYNALKPAVIETPQLRDMGEATPPLEWIGLHRDRLPNLTHQIVIVTLLEVAKEVDDAYSRILGSS